MTPEYDKLNFLVFSDDWGVHPSSCQHLFRWISIRSKVLWVNTIGMRNPNLSLQDFIKASNKIKRMLKTGENDERVRPSDDKVTICQPPMLPFSNVPCVRRLNAKSVTHFVNRRLSALCIDRPVLVTTVPNACDYVGKFNESKVVYYCVDDFTKWPGLENDLVRRMEQDLVAKADMCVATSDKLFENLSRTGKAPILLTHGVDLDLFQKRVSEEHEKINRIPSPRIGYFGLFDERSDQSLLSKLARRMPHVSFVFTGRVEANISRFDDISNVFFIGPVPYRELPLIVNGLDVLILPYVVNELSESISPLKLKEYLSTGKPVVSTPIAEVIKFRKHLVIAKGMADWERALYSCLIGEREQNKGLDNFLKKESWEEKAIEFLDICSRS
jgi:glycosyltransferase involved in cell wall biosynthesis